MNTIFKIATLAAVLTLVACGPEQAVVETEDPHAGMHDEATVETAVPATEAAPTTEAAPATAEGSV